MKRYYFVQIVTLYLKIASLFVILVTLSNSVTFSDNVLFYY